MKSTTSFEMILIILIGIMVLIALITPLYNWVTKQKIPFKEKPKCTEDKCLYSEEGKICIETKEGTDCVCITDEDCDDGKKCKKELGSKYGKCE